MAFGDAEFLKALLSQLQHKDLDYYMILCYNVITMFPNEVLQYDEKTVNHKIDSLDRILKYFEEREDYERCSKIKEVQDKLRKC